MLHSTNYNYTIIIPHKNIPSLLKRCIDSIPKRKDVQIIVVDDNSDSDIVNFDTLSLWDKRIDFIFSKDGKGAGACRNKGLEKALGKWVIFIDADDYLVNNPIDIWDSHINSEADIIYFNVTSADCDSMQLANRHKEKNKESLRLSKNEKQLHRYLRFMYTEPWGKLIKREFLNQENIKFQESLVANDYKFSILTGLKANHIKFDNSIFYCVTVRKDSLSHSMFQKKEKVFSRIEVYSDIQQVFKSNNIKLYPLYSFVIQASILSDIKIEELLLHLKKLRIGKSQIIIGVLKALFSSAKLSLLRKFNLPFCGF